MSNNYDPRDLGIKVPKDNIEDTLMKLDEATEARRLSIEGKPQLDDAYTALQAINNIFRAFNTVSDLRNSQTEECDPDSDLQPKMEREDQGETSSSQTQESMASIQENEHDEGETASEKSVAAKTQDINPDNTSITHTTSSTKSTQDLIETIESKLYFRDAVGDEEYLNIQNLIDFKRVLMNFKSLDEVLLYTKRYVDAGGYMNPEFLFLIINTYSFSRPWKYHDQFRRHVFQHEKYIGLGDEIDQFKNSIKAIYK